MKHIYAEMIKLYPDLIETAKDKTKRKLKPLVLFKSDLDTLEEQMVKNFGADTSQVPIVWKVNESYMQDDTFTNGIPAKDGQEQDGEEGEEEEESPPPAKNTKEPAKKK